MAVGAAGAKVGMMLYEVRRAAAAVADALRVEELAVVEPAPAMAAVPSVPTAVPTSVPTAVPQAVHQAPVQPAYQAHPAPQQMPSAPEPVLAAVPHPADPSYQQYAAPAAPQAPASDAWSTYAPARTGSGESPSWS